MADRQYQWFVEPLGDVAETNARIARALGQEVDNTENQYKQVICFDDKPHNLWGCTLDDAKKLWRSRDSLGIKIQVWSKEGGGKIRPHTFLFTRRLTSRQLAVQKQIQKATKQ